MEKLNEVELVIITGMSGAGKSVAVQAFEDMDYFCVDNLPPLLLPKFWELMHNSGKNKIAVVMDLRSQDFFGSIDDYIGDLIKQAGLDLTILFLDADDEILVTRYKETRRSHPLAAGKSTYSGIKRERELLAFLKSVSQLVLDTSVLKPKQLREKLMVHFLNGTEAVFNVNVMSFGFKYGIPIDADLVFDVRFLPNPFYDEVMRAQTGLEDNVYNYVMKWPDTEQFLDKLLDLLVYSLPKYKREGKTQLLIAIGCTGGQHRSVSLARYIAQALETNYQTTLTHRDVTKHLHDK
ncbi:RNase adapter RapZ [Brochothrix campestris]|uniref:GlmZ(SRNA)-inactivating NTPase n=1 Tax=Brochothrix campestris FSL F6-1037 TaxID=1265861 RepID=W7D1U0_9LIST|nr:RNase adapter RapZ [Brochothrix campestris]EUJ41891.1 glmZ(sRNA)-inactivating NTPase [Brochothrix campestris FSL F6-1037]